MDKKEIKFEYPEKIHNLLKNIDPIDGKVWVWNPEKFQEIWADEFKDRTKFLDLWLAIQFSIDRIISKKINVEYNHFFEEIILTKIGFNDKMLVLQGVLLDERGYGEDKLHFEKIDDKTIKVWKFRIGIGKLIKLIGLIRDIRNQSAHQNHNIFTVRDTITLRSSTNPFKLKDEINKQEILIQGHFALWILTLVTDESEHINKSALKEYYDKYELYLKRIFILEEK